MKSLLTLSVFLVLIKEDNGQKPVVSLQPRFPQVYVGDDVTLICKGGRNPTKWVINGIEQPHQNYVMLLTTVTPHNNGQYECEQNGEKSDPVTLTVLALEALAQLSPSVGGSVITKGEGRNLVLKVDDAEELNNWKCFAFRGESEFKFDGIDVNKKMKRAVIFAELRDAERATFWCMNKNATHRSNAVTLKMTDKLVMLEPPAAPALLGDSVALRCVAWGAEKVEKATFYRNQTKIDSINADTYTIIAKQEDTGMYYCHATFRYSHIDPAAAEKEGDSDAQYIKVIDGPPAANISASGNTLKCFCPKCSDNCTSYYWYYTPSNDMYSRSRLPEYRKTIKASKEGLYCCRMNCGKGFSRFSQLYSHRGQSESVNVWPVILGLLLLVLVLLIAALVAVKRRRQGESSIQAAKDKDKGGDAAVLLHSG
ncbi:high affinity immunoglobulin gamma Fc receptor I [Danio aesculapii]|uniref:high affinity immunoglobulin gamma Fc receptor I n=1 Tax=Danio aesculapii TaxID=1142201 RepID=UPI0024BF605E|nr:high affinity immunoglobulin gamma Fc receptor I [Danio aesculapii]XP_056307084.1 high affinity immunoglobulin gamma Fc receptor I [Danio aesculapii]